MSFVVFVVYRPPTTTNDFFDYISDVLKQYAGGEMILMGDLNFKLAR